MWAWVTSRSLAALHQYVEKLQQYMSEILVTREALQAYRHEFG
jgi:uncharacterized membrane protein YesL